jgi:aryl-alcohol dehydrogenase-like predicted oxidoreductase
VLVAGRYTLLDDAAAASLFPLCQRRGVAVLAGGVFNSSILAGPGGSGIGVSAVIAKDLVPQAAGRTKSFMIRS